MSHVPNELAEQVRLRAGNRCEYCQMHQSLQGATFHIEHVFPASRGGLTEWDNLALCCPSCNVHKADRIDATDPQTESTAPLFNPRKMIWTDHFGWDGYQVVATTNTARATLLALRLNHPRRLRVRAVEEQFKLFPRE